MPSTPALLVCGALALLACTAPPTDEDLGAAQVAAATEVARRIARNPGPLETICVAYSGDWEDPQLPTGVEGIAFAYGEGCQETDGQLFSLADGSENFGSHGEYAEGYRHQTAYVAGQVLAAVDAILARPGPRPVIVIHGDHGPRSSSDPQNANGYKWRERLGIFSAYYFPPGEAPSAVPDDISPVNGLRLVANRYLGTSLPQLPDTSFVSTWDRPYRLEVAAPPPATPVVQATPTRPASHR